jgi:DNA-binding CsgD family transcriptional regulator
MQQLNLNDTQNLLKAIQELSSLHDFNSFSVNTLTIIDRLIPSDIPVFHIYYFRLNQFLYTMPPGYTPLSPELEDVPRRYWQEHPITQNMPLTLTGAYKISDFISEKSFHYLEGLYHQFLRVLDCEEEMVMFFPKILPNSKLPKIRSQIKSIDDLAEEREAESTIPDNPDMFGISLNRSKRNFTERDRLVFNLLRPHLFQAYSNAQYYNQLQQNLTQLQKSFDLSGMIFLDGMGQVKLITSQAANWLQFYFPSHKNVRELPEQLHSWVKHQLSQLEGVYNLPFACLPLHIQQDDRQLIISLIIDQPGEQYILLLAEEQVLSLLAALELIGLSKREAEVLFWLIQGKDNRAIALEIRINYSTVRKHLENIYRKLKVKSQSEAIATALEKVGCLSSTAIV